MTSLFHGHSNLLSFLFSFTKRDFVLGRDLHGVGIIPNKEPSQCNSSDSAKTCLADIV